VWETIPTASTPSATATTVVATNTPTATPIVGGGSRTITYDYDGLQRLISAVETGATSNSYAYTYDNAGNRLTSSCTGGPACPPNTTHTYNAANQVDGWTYDNVGNLLNDGSCTGGPACPPNTYDPLNRLTARSGITFSYNGDGTLVSQLTGGTTTRYTQDLASPLSQILGDGTSTYIYGMDRLYSEVGIVRSWYTADALGSVRAITSNAGIASAVANYDPYGQVQSGNVGSFGFTGELQQGNSVYLRARWYNSEHGGFGVRDAFEGYPEQPYSLHAYQYGYANPVSNTDPSGRCVEWLWNDPSCQFIGEERVRRGDLEWEEGLPWAGAGLDMLPIIGDAKGLAEVFTGCDIVTGEDLGNWRWMGLVFLSELRQLRRVNSIPVSGLKQLPPSLPRVFYSLPNGQLANSVWQLGPGPRGKIIEDILGQNLPENFKTFDRWNPAIGEAVSIKSIDLGPTGSKVSSARSRLRGFINEIAGFTGYSLQNVSFTAADIRIRKMELAVPASGVSQAHWTMLHELKAYAKNRGVIVDIVPIP
jgi:RHS repeat-associated protein